MPLRRSRSARDQASASGPGTSRPSSTQGREQKKSARTGDKRIKPQMLARRTKELHGKGDLMKHLLRFHVRHMPQEQFLVRLLNEEGCKMQKQSCTMHKECTVHRSPAYLCIVYEHIHIRIMCAVIDVTTQHNRIRVFARAIACHCNSTILSHSILSIYNHDLDARSCPGFF